MAQALKKTGFDLVICGSQSTDAGTGELPGALAEYLGVPGVTYLRKLDVEGTTLRGERETDNGYQTVSTQLPALASVTKSINEPRYPSLKGIMGAKKKTIAPLTLAELALDRAVGSDGAKTELLELAAAPARAKGFIAEAPDGATGAQIIVDFLKEKKLL
jgi:electron transfer flavoprotein beta subunit